MVDGEQPVEHGYFIGAALDSGQRSPLVGKLLPEFFAHVVGTFRTIKRHADKFHGWQFVHHPAGSSVVVWVEQRIRIPDPLYVRGLQVCQCLLQFGVYLSFTLPTVEPTDTHCGKSSFGQAQCLELSFYDAECVGVSLQPFREIHMATRPSQLSVLHVGGWVVDSQSSVTGFDSVKPVIRNPKSSFGNSC